MRFAKWRTDVSQSSADDTRTTDDVGTGELRSRVDWNSGSRELAGGAWCDSHVVLGVSGGADSVAMLRAMAALKDGIGGRVKLFVAHLNHGLARDEADADEAGCRSLCERLEMSLEIGKADVSAIAAEQGDGWEAAARSARYDFLRQTAERLGAAVCRDRPYCRRSGRDGAASNLRGTGIEGLAGMPRRSAAVAECCVGAAVVGSRAAARCSSIWLRLGKTIARTRRTTTLDGRAIGCGTSFCRIARAIQPASGRRTLAAWPRRPVKRSTLLQRLAAAIAERVRCD